MVFKRLLSIDSLSLKSASLVGSLVRVQCNSVLVQRRRFVSFHFNLFHSENLGFCGCVEEEDDDNGELNWIGEQNPESLYCAW